MVDHAKARLLVYTAGVGGGGWMPEQVGLRCAGSQVIQVAVHVKCLRRG